MSTTDNSFLPQIIGITGRKFNGKDTLGNILKEKYGYEPIAFASALKDACKCIFGFNDAQLYGDLKETPDEYWKVSPRVILQYVGTELFRDQLQKKVDWIGQDIWIEVIKKKIQDRLKINPEAKFVITDLRFENELIAIKSLGGYSIRIVRPSVNDQIDLHESEINIMNLQVDTEILNDKSLENLNQEISNIFAIKKDQGF